MLLTYYDGRFRNAARPFIPLSDRAVFFGDGIYDAAIAKGGRIFMLEEHLERFLENAAALEIPLPESEDRLRQILLKIAKAAAGDGVSFIYFQLSRYGRRRAHAVSDEGRSNLLITASSLTLKPPCETVSLIRYPDLRHGICNRKTLNLLISVMAAREAEKRGADEAVFVRDGLVTECSHSNVHILKDGVLLTHPTNERILPGISRRHMLSVAGEMGIPIIERPFSEQELAEADEVLVTSTSKLALRARSYEGHLYRTEKDSLGEAIALKMRRDFDIFTK